MLKVKVGGGSGPEADAARSLELLRGSPKGSTLRLDANQAWTMDEALSFSTALAAASSNDGSGTHTAACADLGSVEYIEEPLRNPRLLGELWERSERALPYALDESLGMGRKAFTDDVSCALVSEGRRCKLPEDPYPSTCTIARVNTVKYVRYLAEFF